MGLRKDMSKMELNQGTTVTRYKIIRKLDYGYPANVYLAADNKLERELILQFMPQQISQEPEAEKSFNRQAQTIAAISHPNIIHIYDVGEYQSLPFVVMEYVGQRTLHDVIREGGLSPRHALDTAIQICRGLRALHEAGIVDFNLRPDQIAVNTEQQVRLLMMEYFRWMFEGINRKRPTESTDYMPPDSTPESEPGTDTNIYSLGIILYEMCTGKHPFRKQPKATQSHSAVSYEDVVIPGNSNIPRELHHILEKSLSKNHESRYLRIEYLQEDLETARTVHALRESEDQYRNVVQRANDGICIIQNRTLKFINKRLADMVGYTVDEGLNTAFVDYLHHNEIPRVVEKYNLQITGQETSQRYETTLIHRDGHEIPVEVNAGLITYEDNRAILAIVRDISLRKEAEKALRESEEKYSALFHQSNDAILVHKLDGQIIDANQKSLTVFGYKLNEMLSLTIADLHPSSALDTSRQAFETVSREGVVNFEIDFKRKSGEVIAAEVSASLFEVGGESVVQGIVRDITDRKKAEQAILESRRALATLMDNLPGMVYRCRNDRDWTMEFVSNGCKNLTGYEISELIGNAALSYNDLIHPEDREDVWQDVQKSIAKKAPFQLVYRIYTKDNREKWVWEQGCGVYDERGNLQALEGFITDITQRKQTEDHLQRLSSIVKQSTEGIALSDLDGNLEYVNMAFAEMHGYKPEELLHRNLSMFHSSEQMPAVEAANRQVREKGSFVGEIWHTRKNGSTFLSKMYNSLFRDGSGNPIGMIRVMRDTTDQKKAEQALQAANEQLDATLNALPDLLFEVDREGHILDFRAPDPQLLYLPPEKFMGRKMKDCIPKDAADVVQEAIVEAFAKGKSSGGTYMLETPRGPSWFELSAAIRGDIKAPDCHVIVLIRDITSRKQTENALRKSEEKYRRIFEDSVLGLYRTTPDGQVLMVNPALLKMLGYSSLEELSRRNLEDSGYEPGYERVFFKEMIERDGVVAGLESAWIKKDGSTLHVRESARAIRDDNGRVIYYEGTVEDITERKRAEQEAAKVAKMIEQERNMFVDGPVVVFKWQNRPGWPMEYVSPNVEQVFGYNVEELVSEQITYAKIIPEEDIASVIDEVTAYSESRLKNFSHQPYRIIRKDGKIIWVSDYTTIIRNDDGKITHYLGYVIDITERQLAEEMLRKRTEQLSNERKALKDKNIALNQILDHIESQRQDHQKQVYREVEQAVRPFLNKLREKAGADWADEFQALHDSFYAILARDMDEFTSKYATLTSRESEICDLIKKGMSSKQISESLNISVLTVLEHRKQIRKKLGITNRSVNLATYLRSH